MGFGDDRRFQWVGNLSKPLALGKLVDASLKIRGDAKFSVRITVKIHNHHA